MKKVLSFLLVLLVSLMPVFNVDAAEGTNKVNFYIFYGEGCGFCASLHSYTDELVKDKKYKDMFNIVDYEVWSNTENNNLMASVADYFGTEVKGVPFYVIGDKYFSGFSAESSPAQIEAAIKEAYENEDYFDVVAGIGKGTLTKPDADLDENGEKNNDLVGYIILGITAIIVVAIIFGRSKDEYYDEDEETEEEVEEEIEEEVKPKKVVKKTNNTKAASKSTTTKKSTAKSTASKKTTTTKSSAKKKTTSKKK